MFTQSLSDIQLAKMLQVATLLLVPVGVLLVLLLYKLLSLLQYALDFFNIARFDLIPIIQDVRAITAHAAKLSNQVDAGVKKVNKSVDKIKPALGNVSEMGKTGIGKLKKVIIDGIGSLLKTDAKPSSPPSAPAATTASTPD